MLGDLRRIVQEATTARDLDEVLGVILRGVRENLQVDVCSVYLCDFDRKEHVLVATEGLNPEAVGRVRLAFGEGLVGLVASRAEPVNVEDAPARPEFRYVPGSGEEPFHAFLGVPVIHHRRVLGVLVVQHRERRRFDDDEVAFLVTLAAQVAMALHHAELTGELRGRRLGRPWSGGSLVVEGLPGAPGIGMGTAVEVYSAAQLMTVPDGTAADAEAEEAALRRAFASVRSRITGMRERLGETLPADAAALFDAYCMMLGEGGLEDDAVARVRAGAAAAAALRDTVREHARVFEAMEDEYLRERAADIRDLGARVMDDLLARERAGRVWPERTVLVARELGASHLAEVPRERLAAVVSATGSGSSHVAILARALGIPCVMGAEGLPLGGLEGEEVIVDGYRGRVYVRPSESVRTEFRRLIRQEARLGSELEALRNLPAVTRDGVRVPLMVNTGLLADIGPSLRSGAEGVGLYRTEFPFLVRDRFPGEEEQYRIYRQVLEAFAPRPVVARTLDIGGDKILPYFAIQEANPFLGWRGIRVALDHPEIFLTQLRALLRADEGLGNLRILLPMITDVSELDQAARLLDQAVAELREEGHAVERPPVGAMIEVPSAVYLMPAIARRVAFVSVGTNDLTQYLLAVDRNNARVAGMYDGLHPAVVAALHDLVRAARRAGCPVSVCGELAGDPAAALLLLGMGVDSLSMSAASLPRVKWVIRSFARAEAEALLEEAMAMESASAVRERLNEALEERGLGGLVRPGA
ncbi:phosphoenolpyruvate--protein phosphotransferase [Inmirania thermothiophila]|uniref:phosphoenolpyruvate--protein phosphotransferase n=1 Tax=Inmirania thermothiophila TaxID=1750597 RepID=A0A3N1YBH1_9GAMM|nr:phosphoenolpyruvate--protein phosphotransferase [Inmirania thermothiophila]ROR35002.1 phosphotransferase system enzyme I (PtsP) [Inmirania thermothiophila]